MAVAEALSPFRAIGNVCGDVPVSFTLMYGEPVLMVATGRSFLLYRGKELTMLRGGPSFEAEVTAVAQTGRFRFVGEGGRIHAFSHHKRMWTLEHSPVLRVPVHHLIARDDLLFSHGADNMVVVRHVKSGDVLNTIAIDGSEAVAAMLLLEGYTNKLLVSTTAGNLQLFNFRTGELLVKHKVETEGHVMSMACSAYKNIVALGSTSGTLTVLNVATMEAVCVLRHEGVAVTSVVFRPDKEGFLVSGTSAGEIAVWDLANRCLDGVLTRSKQVASRLEAFDTPHTEPVHTLMFFPKGSMLVSASSDNALMQFRFDTVDGLGLLVRERRGHMGECTAVKFYNSDLIVTAGVDQALRVTHVFSDRASWELSQGKLGRRGRDQMVGREMLKLPPVTRLDASASRNYQWGSVVSLHESSALTCTWRMDTRALENKLSGISTGMHTARSVAISGCGNLAVVGYSSGNVSLINLQNKSIKQFFISPTEKRAHSKSVEAVEVACGNTVAVSAGLDGNMMLWDLQSTKLIKTVHLGRPVRLSCLHEPSSLFIAVQDQEITVFNCSPHAQRPEHAVRCFEGHKAPITAMALTPDTQRHVVSASADAVLMVSDLAAGVCVGLYRVASPVTSLSFHPDALFLATTHLGERGSFLWTNNLRYGFAPEVVVGPLDQDVEHLPLLHYPAARDERSDEEEVAPVAAASEATTAALENDVVDLFDEGKDTALARRRQDALHATMLDELPCLGIKRCGLPRNVWFNITVIDQLKEKNQPLLPPKKRDVPFFLPTTSELRPTFILQLTNAKTQATTSRFVKDLGALTPVQQLLFKGEFEGAMKLLKALSAQEMDLELRTFVDFSEDAELNNAEKERIRQCLLQLLKFLEHHIRDESNADLVQGMLTSILKQHGPLLIQAGPEVLAALQALMEAQRSMRLKLQHLVGYPNCLLGTFTGATV